MLEPHAGLRCPISDVQVHAPNEACPRIREQHDAWRYDATSVQPADWLRKAQNSLGMNCLARLPAVQIETIEGGFLPCIDIRGRNAEHIGFHFHNAHGRMGECE